MISLTTCQFTCKKGQPEPRSEVGGSIEMMEEPIVVMAPTPGFRGSTRGNHLILFISFSWIGTGMSRHRVAKFPIQGALESGHQSQIESDWSCK